MSTVSVHNYSLLENARRLDAEFYKPHLMTIIDFLHSKPHAKLGKENVIRSGTTPPDRDDSPKDGIVLLKTVDIQNGILPIKGDYYRISKEIDERMSKTRINPRDVLINIVGATLDVIGRVSFVPEGFESANITQAMALLRPKPSARLQPEYLFSFLRTRYGLAQVYRTARPTGQYNLNLQELSGFIIPIFSNRLQNAIRELVNISASKQSKSFEDYYQAEQLLLAELGLQDWKPTHALTFVKSYSQAAKAQRIDAEYFHPKYDEIAEHISAYHPQRLSKLANQIIETLSFDSSKTYRYIEIGDVNTNNSAVGYTEREVKDLPPNAKIKVRGGELIVSKVRPTRGAIGIVPDDCQENGVCSSAFVVLDVAPPIREFLQVYLRSAVGRALLEQPCKGTSYPTIDDIDVMALPVPTISAQTQETISKLVTQSRLARQEAKALLEKAKRAVEIAIEESEEKAMEFIG